MPKHFQPLATSHLSENNHYISPPSLPELVHLDDPATDILINFEIHGPAITQPKNLIDDAMVEMKAHGAHMMLVVDDHTVQGVISSEDILGEKPMQIIQERRIKRSEIVVRTVMTPREKLVAISYHDLTHSKVGHVLATLSHSKHHYLIVVDKKEGDTHETVHGLIYLYDILKRLDKNLTTEMREASSLLELQKYMR